MSSVNQLKLVLSTVTQQHSDVVAATGLDLPTMPKIILNMNWVSTLDFTKNLLSYGLISLFKPKLMFNVVSSTLIVSIAITKSYHNFPFVCLFVCFKRHPPVFFIRQRHISVRSTLPPLSAMSALSVLDVSGNVLSALPPSLAELPRLYTVKANNNRIEKLEVCGEWDERGRKGNEKFGLPCFAMIFLESEDIVFHFLFEHAFSFSFSFFFDFLFINQSINHLVLSISIRNGSAKWSNCKFLSWQTTMYSFFLFNFYCLISIFFFSFYYFFVLSFPFSFLFILVTFVSISLCNFPKKLVDCAICAI